MKIMMLGSRGVPNIQGGVETHVEQLSQELVRLGCDVEVLTRSPYGECDRAVHSEWRGVKLTRVWSPRSSHLEAIVHTFLGVLVAAWQRPDLLHIHAIGPGLLTPLARLFGLRVVVTHHGFDYEREKWSKPSKLVLQLGEYCAMRFAHTRIAVSESVAASVQQRFSKPCRVIHNGIHMPTPVSSAAALERFGISSSRYVLNVSRLVPEKCHLDLIAAFARSGLKDWQLVLVGGADHNSSYAEMVHLAASEYANVIMTGQLQGTDLAEIYAHAGVFVLPSSHEGMPIVLLEALSYGLPTLASGISANREVGMAADRYFQLHDVEGLGERLRQLAEAPGTAQERASIAREITARYSWQQIGRQTFEAYQATVRTGGGSWAAQMS